MLRIEITLPPNVALELDPRLVRAVLRSAGSEIAAVARRKIRQAVGGGRVYYGKGKGRHLASLPGNPPATWTGMLANSISTRVFRSGDGVLIRDVAFYARFLETGAKGGGGRRGNRNKRSRTGIIKPAGSRVLAPRPFISTAAAERAPSIGARVQEALLAGVKFRRISAAKKIEL